MQLGQVRHQIKNEVPYERLKYFGVGFQARHTKDATILSVPDGDISIRLGQCSK